MKKIFYILIPLLLIIISFENVYPCGYEGDAKVEMLGFSKDNSSFALRYVYYKTAGESVCKYPSVNGIKPTQVALLLYQSGKKPEHWTIYKDPEMDYGFEYVKSKGEKVTCTSHKNASIILKKAKEAFKKAGIIMKYKGEIAKLSKLKIKKNKKEVKFNCINIPVAIMKKYGCNSPVSIYSDFTRQIPEKGHTLHSYYAYTKGYKKVIIESWEVMNFHFYRSFGSAWFSPDKSKLIFTYNNAAGPNKPIVVNIKEMAEKIQRNL